MIKELVALANKLDSLGLYKEADLIDLNLEKYFRKNSQQITQNERYQSQNEEADTPQNNAAWEKYISSTPKGLEVRNSWEIFADYTSPWETTYTDFVKWWKESFKSGSIGKGSVDEVLKVLRSSPGFAYYQQQEMGEQISSSAPKANPLPHSSDKNQQASTGPQRTDKPPETRPTDMYGNHKSISKKYLG